LHLTNCPVLLARDVDNHVRDLCVIVMVKRLRQGRGGGGEVSAKATPHCVVNIRRRRILGAIDCCRGNGTLRYVTVDIHPCSNPAAP